MRVTDAIYDKDNQLMAPYPAVWAAFVNGLKQLNPYELWRYSSRAAGFSNYHHHDMPMTLTPGAWHYWGVTVNQPSKVNRVIRNLADTMERANGTIVSFNITTMANNDLTKGSFNKAPYLYHIAVFYVIETVDHIPFPRVPDVADHSHPDVHHAFDIIDPSDHKAQMDYGSVYDPKPEVINASIGRLHEPFG